MIDPMEVLKMHAPAIPTGLPTSTPSSVPTKLPSVKPGPSIEYQVAGEVGSRVLW